MADNRPIGVFDSGLGGLTVVKELKKTLQSEDIIYFGDTDRVPYGTKSNQTIRKFALQDEAFLLSHDVKLIVAACGTVSSVAADTADSLPVPFVGVVDNAAYAAVNATKNKKIGVIGTSATINSGAHKREILRLLPDAKVFEAACTLFVPFVESGFIDKDDSLVLTMVERYLTPLKQKGVDTLILGCTHYPLLSDTIKKVMGENVTLINMGVSTADAVKNLLVSTNSLNEENKCGKTEFYVSDITPSFAEISSMLLGKEVKNSDVIEVDISKI